MILKWENIPRSKKKRLESGHLTRCETTPCNHAGNRKKSNKSQGGGSPSCLVKRDLAFWILLTGGNCFKFPIEGIHFSTSRIFVLRYLRWNCRQTINHLAWNSTSRGRMQQRCWSFAADVDALKRQQGYEAQMGRFPYNAHHSPLCCCLL